MELFKAGAFGSAAVPPFGRKPLPDPVKRSSIKPRYRTAAGAVPKASPQHFLRLQHHADEMTLELSVQVGGQQPVHARVQYNTAHGWYLEMMLVSMPCIDRLCQCIHVLRL
jgi:hypothetical protein